MGCKARRGFTLIELAVVIVLVLIVVSVLLPSLGGGGQSPRAFCANNQAQFIRAMHVYAQEYKYFPPHNPLPGYWPDNHPVVKLQGAGFDPSLGWLLTCGMRLTPPETFVNKTNPANPSGHFKWYVLNEDELPDIVICPAAKRELMFEPNPQIDPVAPLETFVYQYAAFYQVNGMIRSDTPVQREAQGGEPSIGGCNPLRPDLSNPATARPALNAVGRMPCIRVARELPGGNWPGVPLRTESVEYWVQARQPSEVDDPGRVYYMADSRERRAASDYQPGSELPGTTNDGWLTTGSGKVVLGARHGGLANVGYMDGHVNADACVADPNWNETGGWTQKKRSETQRACTFSDTAAIPGLGNQHRLLPAMPNSSSQGPPQTPQPATVEQGS